MTTITHEHPAPACAPTEPAAGPAPVQAPAAPAEAERLIDVPALDTSYVVSPEVDSLLERIDVMALEAPQKVLLKGPHGAGKTEMAVQFAARTGRPLLIMDCANLREPRDWFGYRTLSGGEVTWHTSLFVRVLQAGHCVILLDEINRNTPSVNNVLNPLLDGRGATYLEELGRRIEVGPNTVFFATMNEGAMYTGTHAMDAAMRDRWPRIVEVTYLPRESETALLVKRTGIRPEHARGLVAIATQVRARASGLEAVFSESISTRQLIAAARDFRHGGAESLAFTLANHFSAEGGANSERAGVLQLIQGQFARKAAR